MIYRRTKLVRGVGINDADYVTQTYEVDASTGKRKSKWKCPIYAIWVGMLQRCYSTKLHQIQPTYADCTVCEEWKVFSKFKQWVDTQDYINKELDKDLLCKGNKVYSPTTCVFIPKKLNAFLLDSTASRGNYLLGTHWHKPLKKFAAKCGNPFTNSRKHLGYFAEEVEAHLAWKAYKHSLAIEFAKLETDPRIIAALSTRFI